jgi:hypothetical protein
MIYFAPPCLQVSLASLKYDREDRLDQLFDDPHDVILVPDFPLTQDFTVKLND